MYSRSPADWKIQDEVVVDRRSGMNLAKLMARRTRRELPGSDESGRFVVCGGIKGLNGVKDKDEGEVVL
ncbi:MAG: hypothetical protein Q9227_000983 [Pyrenula ochraceoflavens]